MSHNTNTNEQKDLLKISRNNTLNHPNKRKWIPPKTMINLNAASEVASKEYFDSVERTDGLGREFAPS